MKLIQAIRTIEDNGRMNEEHRRMNLIHVQSVFPHEDVIALKKKANESSISEAISKAVHHYLRCTNTDEDYA